MASGDSIEHSLRQLLKCHVCAEPVDVLKALPCQHVVCLPCARQLPVVESRYHCPTCQQKHPMPNGGMGQLPNSLGLQHISDILKRKQAKSSAASKPARQLLSGGGGFGIVPTSSKVSRRKVKKQQQPKKVRANNSKASNTSETGEDINKLRNRLQKSVDSALEWCTLATNKIAHDEKKLENLPEQTETVLEVVSKYREEMVQKCTEKIADATQAAVDTEAEVKETLEKVQTYLDQIEQMTHDVSESLAKISTDDRISLAVVIEAQRLYYDMVELNRNVRPPNFLDVSAAEKISDGDCVRLKQDGHLNVRKLVDNMVSPKSVGVYFKSAEIESSKRGFFEFRPEKMEAVMFPEGLWTGNLYELEKAHTTKRLPGIGDQVRLKAGTYKETYELFGEQHDEECDSWCKDYVAESVGVMEKLKIVERGGVNLFRVPGEFAVIDFPERRFFKHTYSDTELAEVTSSLLQEEDQVRVNRNIPEPSRGWGGVTGSSIGKVIDINFVDGQEEIVVKFKNCKKWVGLPSDLETYIYPQVGDKVQFRLFVPSDVLCTGITHDHVGILKDIEDDDNYGYMRYQNAVVEFPGEKPLRCNLEQVEPVRYQPPDYDVEVSSDEMAWSTFRDYDCDYDSDYDNDYGYGYDYDSDY